MRKPYACPPTGPPAQRRTLWTGAGRHALEDQHGIRERVHGDDGTDVFAAQPLAQHVRWRLESPLLDRLTSAVRLAAGEGLRP